MKKVLIMTAFFLVVFSFQTVFSENIRGDVVKTVFLSGNSTKEENTFNMSLEDVFSISFDENANFLSGIEIEIKTPAPLRSFTGSIAFEIFKQISPEATTGIGNYYGKDYNIVFLPETSKFYLQIPYVNNFKQEDTPYTITFKEPLNYSDFPVMITSSPVMKGFPSDLYNTNFTISVYPIFKESGTLDLNIEIDENLDVSQLYLGIDGEKITIKETSAKISLLSGRHSLTAEIEGGLGVTRTFSVSPGETTPLNIQLNHFESFLVIDVPDNTEIFLDGELKQLSKGNKLKAEPGEHTILFMIGDYKISKRFNLSPGKDCKISLFLDILVEEN